MDVAEGIRRVYKNISERRWDDVVNDELVTPSTSFHAPGLGIEAPRWEDGMAALRPLVEAVDGHYEVVDVVEHDPLVVAFVSCTGTVDGRPAAWSACSVARVADGKVVENWTIRGSDPAPVEA